MNPNILELDNTLPNYLNSAYVSWVDMLYRCQDPKSKGYKYYGARGITVCTRWQNFENFLSDIGERPEGLSLERKDNSKGYYPGNCKWATRFEQQNNTRKNKLFIALGPDGQEELAKNQQAFARRFDLVVGNLNKCLKGERTSCEGWKFVYIPEDYPRYKELLRLFNS